MKYVTGRLPSATADVATATPVSWVELRLDADRQVDAEQREVCITPKSNGAQGGPSVNLNNSKEERRPMQPVPRPPPPRERWDEDSVETWPMYLGIALFVIIVAVFTWCWYDDNYGPGSTISEEL